MASFVIPILSATVVVAASTNVPSGACTVNGKPVDCGRFFSIFGPIWLLFMAVLISFGVFWLMMLIHAAKNNVPNKTAWILLIVLLQFPAIIYYFAVKRKFQNVKIQQSQSPAPQSPVNPSTPSPTNPLI